MCCITGRNSGAEVTSATGSPVSRRDRARALCKVVLVTSGLGSGTLKCEVAPQYATLGGQGHPSRAGECESASGRHGERLVLPSLRPDTGAQPSLGEISMAVTGIDFWFSVGSTYTYLAVMRLPEVEKATGVRFRWRPFSVRAIMREMNNVPFATKPIKMAYMWRDIERRAAAYGLPVRLPAPYPLQEFDLANRVAVLGATKAGVPTTCGQPTGAGSRRASRPAANPTCPTPCARLDRNRLA
jgi:hypothetical protein